MLFALKFLAPGPQPKHPGSVKHWEPLGRAGVYLKEIKRKWFEEEGRGWL
jgi:hypothetical protein